MHWFFLSDRQEQIPTTEDQIPTLVANGVIRPNTMLWREGLANWITAGELKPELFANLPVQIHSPQPARATQGIRNPQSTATRNPYAAPQAVAGGREGGSSSLKEYVYPIGRSNGWIYLCSVVQTLVGLAFTAFWVWILIMLMKDKELVRIYSAVKILIPFVAIISLFIIIGLMLAWMGIVLFQAASRLGNAYSLGSKDDFYGGLHSLGTYFKLMGMIVLIGILLFVGFYFLGKAAEKERLKRSNFNDPFSTVQSRTEVG
jgi:GYF domain 2/Family of unknown function (DUF5362)